MVIIDTVPCGAFGAFCGYVLLLFCLSDFVGGGCGPFLALTLRQYFMCSSLFLIHYYFKGIVVWMVWRSIFSFDESCILVEC